MRPQGLASARVETPETRVDEPDHVVSSNGVAGERGCGAKQQARVRVVETSRRIGAATSPPMLPHRPDRTDRAARAAEHVDRR